MVQYVQQRKQFDNLTSYPSRSRTPHSLDTVSHDIRGERHSRPLNRLCKAVRRRLSETVKAQFIALIFPMCTNLVRKDSVRKTKEILKEYKT